MRNIRGRELLRALREQVAGVLPYGLAVIAVGLTVLLAQVDRFSGLAFMLFLCAVMAATWVGGARPRRAGLRPVRFDPGILLSAALVLPAR
jgi:hypothetical protein